LVVQPVGNRNVALIPPAPIVGLVAPDEYHGTPLRIEGEEGPIVLEAQLLHVVVTGPPDRSHEGPPQARALDSQHLDPRLQSVPQVSRERLSPLLRRRLELDFPLHAIALCQQPSGVTQKDTLSAHFSDPSR
jgi:hypothetical protein